MKRINLVDIYRDYIKKEGTFDFGVIDLERLGLTGILAFYRLDIEALTEEEREELWKELKLMAEEHDFTEDFERINQGD